jgi:hypothetical protein
MCTADGPRSTGSEPVPGQVNEQIFCDAACYVAPRHYVRRALQRTAVRNLLRVARSVRRNSFRPRQSLVIQLKIQWKGANMSHRISLTTNPAASDGRISLWQRCRSPEPSSNGERPKSDT